MDLSQMPKLKGKHKPAKRVGRGVGSGKGSHTTGKGQKGQKSRSGANIPVGFEGGQVPLYMKMPKRRGFINPHREKTIAINLNILNMFKDDEKITPEDLVKKGLFREVPQGGVKILGNGELEKKLNLEGFKYSKSATEKIEKLGGIAK